MAQPCSALRLRGVAVEAARAGSDGVRLDVRVDAPVPRVRPSQFFMLRRGDGEGPFLARPFSLYLRRPTPQGDVFSFLLKVIGAGTRALSSLAPGEPVELVGPLGNGFPEPRRDMKLACVAGGVGIATFPLVFEDAIEKGVSPGRLSLLFGAARRDLLYEIERYREMGIEFPKE